MKHPKRFYSNVNVVVETDKYGCFIHDIQSVASAALTALKKDKKAVSVVLVDNATIRTYNQRYRKKRRVTDVLAFPAIHEITIGNKGTYRYLGDVVISLDQTKKNAAHFSVTFKEELFRYVIHGLLHLLGYVDYTKKEKKMMTAKQEKLLQCILRSHRYLLEK